MPGVVPVIGGIGDVLGKRTAYDFKLSIGDPISNQFQGFGVKPFEGGDERAGNVNVCRDGGLGAQGAEQATIACLAGKGGDFVEVLVEMKKKRKTHGREAEAGNVPFQ